MVPRAPAIRSVASPVGYASITQRGTAAVLSAARSSGRDPGAKSAAMAALCELGRLDLHEVACLGADEDFIE